jgi:hypothetical protein
VFGEAHLRQILRTYATSYNEVRTHLSLDKDAPKSRPAQKIGSILMMPILGGLRHQYVRVWVFGIHNEYVRVGDEWKFASRKFIRVHGLSAQGQASARPQK